MLIMSTLDLKKTVHIIVHGQTNLVGTVKEKLIGLGFSENSLLQASLDKVGNEGDYVAMAWPPMDCKTDYTKRDNWYKRRCPGGFRYGRLGKSRTKGAL